MKRSAIVVAILTLGGVFALPAFLVGCAIMIAALTMTGGATGSDLCVTGETLTVAGQPAGDVAGYSGEQLENAAVILTVGQQRGVPARAQTIAVMTAMGESGMRNLGYGDDRYGVRNPDGTLTSSIGMFQEQKWYGSVASRLDPYQSSARFYDRLLAVPGWDTLEPTIAAHKAQRNRDPYHYAKYWPAAVDVVQALSGNQTTQTTGLAAGQPCTPEQAPGGVGPGGWANPAIGRKASGYGPRNTGIPGASRFHLGQDIANACGTPIYAAASGTVVLAGATSWGTGNTIRIDHGAGVDTMYGHLLTGTIQVQVGQHVTAGQPIASMGGDRNIDPAGAGTSSGCHLHLEVRENGKSTDPDPYFKARGITLGQGE